MLPQSRFLEKMLVGKKVSNQNQVGLQEVPLHPKGQLELEEKSDKPGPPKDQILIDHYYSYIA